MATVMPDDELLRKAIRYVDEALKEQGKSKGSALEEAAMRYNLGPVSCQYLHSVFSDHPAPEDKKPL
jgi:hypothetical protein